MDERELKAALRDLPLGGLRYFDQTGSTNAVALAWATEGAPDLSLVLADEQTAGRGRSGRKWYTPAGTALAFSLILRPKLDEHILPSLFSGLGALALVQALHECHGLTAQIKWPNDVLLQGRKVAGVLVEVVWLGEKIESLVLGLGVNVRAAAVPPPEALDFPAVSVEEMLARPVERVLLLHDILAALIAWRPRLDSGGFLEAWEDALAYRGEQVQVRSGAEAPLIGQLLGLEPDGGLRLKSSEGRPLSVHFGDVHLRPVGV